MPRPKDHHRGGRQGSSKQLDTQQTAPGMCAGDKKEREKEGTVSSIFYSSQKLFAGRCYRNLAA